MIENLARRMKQYYEAKRACPDALLLFRMGDFYELFHDDAIAAARTLDLALTSRDKGEIRTPMAGFPHQQLENYLAKLIAAGLQVAVCDRVIDSKRANEFASGEIRWIDLEMVSDEHASGRITIRGREDEDGDVQ